MESALFRSRYINITIIQHRFVFFNGKNDKILIFFAFFFFDTSLSYQSTVNISAAKFLLLLAHSHMCKIIVKYDEIIARGLTKRFFGDIIL
jgi:hypothetical protein